MKHIKSYKLFEKEAHDSPESYIRHKELKAAQDANTSPRELEELAQSDFIDVLTAVSENPNTPKEVLVQLSDHRNANVLNGLATNPNTPVEILVKLIDYGGYVTNGVAANPSTPIEELTRLSRKDQTGVDTLVWIAKNPSITRDLLAELGNNVMSWRIRLEVARNPKTPVDTLSKLSRDGDEDVRLGTAENPNTPVEDLDRLAGDIEWGVRYQVALNPNTSADTLIKLSQDELGKVTDAAKGNPNYPDTTSWTLDDW
jgi:pentose-5-phosphate-3-epimerase